MLKKRSFEQHSYIPWENLPTCFGFEEIDYLLHKIDLKFPQERTWPIMEFIELQKKLNLRPAQWDYILEHTDFDKIQYSTENKYWSPIMYALYEKKNLPLTTQQWFYFMEKCPLEITEEMLSYLLGKSFNLKKIKSY